MYTFNDIIGQEEIVNHIQNAIDKDMIAHAYIIDGERGMGKKLIARTFAKTLQCEKSSTTPCDECVSCKTFDSGNHPDVIYISSTKKKGIGVDDIREQMNKDINIKPYHYKYKIYIIDDADTMTEQAQNALLKTIEEPPSYARILLLSNNRNKFLPTIISRCVVLKLKPITLNDLIPYIINELHIPKNQAELYASFSQGKIGRVNELVKSNEFIEMRENIIKIIEQLFTSDEYAVFTIEKELEMYKSHFEEVMDLFISWFRDVLIVKELKDDQYVIHRDKYNSILKQSNRLSYNKIGNILEELIETKNKMKYNVNFQLLVELMLLNIKES